MTTYLLLFGVPLILGLYAQMRVSSAFGKYKKVAATSGVTGAQAAREILNAAQIHDVEVREINDMLGDHYDPLKKRLCLSTDVYHNPSVAALGIAAHEAGHAIQHARAYAPLKWRMAIVPITKFAAPSAEMLCIVGLALGAFGLVKLGILCFAIVAVFQLITLPVEFDASKRAKVILQQMGMIQPGGESNGVNAVLNAAALTYLAALVTALGGLAFWLLKAREHE